MTKSKKKKVSLQRKKRRKREGGKQPRSNYVSSFHSCRRSVKIKGKKKPNGGDEEKRSSKGTM